MPAKVRWVSLHFICPLSVAIAFMNTFAIITGIATLLGFALQLRDSVPKYRKYYVPVTWSLLGLTSGLGIGSFANVTFLLPSNLSTRNIAGLLLYGGSGLLIFLLFTASTMIVDEKRRREICQIGSAVSGFLIFLLLFFSSFFFPESSPSPQNDSIALSYDEHIDCGLIQAKKGNFGRAIELFTEAKKSIQYDDPRYDSVDSLITQTIKKQNASHTSAVESVDAER